MFKLESEPWIKADMERGQEKPILTWRNEYNTVLHLISDDHQYMLIIGFVPSSSEPKINFKPMTHWPKDVLKDIAEHYPLED